MRDIDDADALGFQIGDEAEQHFDLVRRQGGGRFIQDQDTGVVRQRLGDFDDLLLADAQLVQHGIRVDRLFQPLHQRAGGSRLLAGVDVDAKAGGGAAKKDIFDDGHVGKQVQVLKHDADASGDSIGVGPELDRLARHLDPAFGQRLDPGNHPRQCGFAGTVFADQHIDRPHPQVEIDRFQGAGAGIDLGAAPDGHADGVDHGATAKVAGVTRMTSVALWIAKAPAKRTVRPVRSPSGT